MLHQKVGVWPKWKKVVRHKSGSKKAPVITQAERLCHGRGNGHRSSPRWMKNWWGSLGNPSWVTWWRRWRGTPMPLVPSSGCVLTDAVLQMQRNTITAINDVSRELREIKNVFSELNTTMKEFIKWLFRICFHICIFTSDASHPNAGARHVWELTWLTNSPSD